ncbi:MAG: hypothetical protein M3317_12520 [Actinomycetota bacterium]|nr:hypothetical protein [Actinomycetota bacterium]
MRRLGLILSVAVLATFLISIATLSAAAQTNKSGDISLAPLPRLWGSQGTVTGEKPSRAERRAAKLDLAEEENLPYYAQVVDNAQSERFDAPGWEQVGPTVGPMEATTRRREPPPLMPASS